MANGYTDYVNTRSQKLSTGMVRESDVSAPNLVTHWNAYNDTTTIPREPMTPNGMYGLPGQYTYTPPPAQPYLVSPYGKGKKYAQQTRAALARAEFEDYKRRYLPLELQAINEMTQDYGVITDQEKDRTEYAINNAYTAAKGMHERRLGRYGLTPSKDDASMDRSNVSSVVGGINSATRNAEDRRMAFIGSGMNTMSAKKSTEGG